MGQRGTASGRGWAERGMVTVELAMGIVSLLLITTAAMSMVWVIGQQVRCVDTAGEVARQLARGDRAAADRAAAARPAGATVTTARQGADAVVEVRLTARPLGILPGVPLTARAHVALEPGAQS